MSTFSDNVQKLRVSKGLTQRELAEKLGVSKSTIGKWESSDTLPDLEGMENVADFFEVTVGALFWEDMEIESLSPFIDAPLYGKIAAGTPIEMIEEEDMFPIPAKIMSSHPRSFLLEVKGESMNRKLPNGCYALIDPDRREPLLDNHPYAVCVNGHDATIKRVKRLNNGFELRPDSVDPTFKPVVYDYGVEGTEMITVIGEVVWYSIPFDFEI